jgi:hypothetical protein
VTELVCGILLEAAFQWENSHRIGKGKKPFTREVYVTMLRVRQYQEGLAVPFAAKH